MITHLMNCCQSVHQSTLLFVQVIIRSIYLNYAIEFTILDVCVYSVFYVQYCIIENVNLLYIVVSGRAAVFATRDTSLLTGANPLPLPMVPANLGNIWNSNTHSFTMPAMEGIYFIAINAGANREHSTLDYKLQKNGEPFIHCSSPWTPGSDRYTQNKDIIARLHLEDTLHVSTSSGVGSNVNRYPSVGIISLSTAMDPLEDLVIFSMARNTTVSGELNPVPFNVELVNDERYYDIFSHTFVAPSDGVYWFSFSVGLEAGQGTEFTLYKNDEPYTNILRTSTTHAGTEQISRSILLELRFLDTIHVVNGGSSVMSSQMLETSFSGFKYEPAHNTPVSLHFVT